MPSILLVATLALPGARPPMVRGQDRLSITSVPVSSLVLATIVSTEDDLRLLVLWRGARREWYAAGPRRESGGGRNRTFSATLQYGDLHLDLEFDATKSEALVQGTKVPMPPGANVLLVDGVDGHAGPSSVRPLAIDPGGTNWEPQNGIASLAPLLERSSAVVDFLRCGAEGERNFTTSPCHHFSKR